jgi:hypothetical protein
MKSTRFGVLVSKTFPKEALGNNACLMKTREGNSVILVKPEYAPLAYVGLRQAHRGMVPSYTISRGKR